MGLRIARKLAKLSQKELTERTHGVADQAVISRFESGDRNLERAPYRILAAIAGALGITVDELIAVSRITDPVAPQRKPRHEPGHHPRRRPVPRRRANAGAAAPVTE